ncbi:hypothetical protein [Streptomyces decoyicus]|uniref:hypothetical protein n=1 Tax=Streptomyces decoyicus TaxID=249567 RepID=UPI003C12BAC9
MRLPDGRALWFFSDTFLDRIQPPPNPQGQKHRWRTAEAGGVPLLRHNSAVVMSRSGRLERTLTGGTAAAPGPFLPDPPGGGRRWPVRASVEPRTPGAHEKVVRVLLWNRAPGTGPWIFGVPHATEVATLSLPALRPRRHHGDLRPDLRRGSGPTRPLRGGGGPRRRLDLRLRKR